jgi:hypothetical protein
MKITRRKLKQVIDEATQISAMKRYEKDSQDLMTVTALLLRGIQTLIGEDLVEEDKYEYGQDLRAILAKNIAATRNIAELFEEIRFARREPEDSTPEGAPEYDMAAQLQDTMSGEELAAIGADYDEDGNLK